MCYADSIVIVDYKTQRISSSDDLLTAAQPYREQLRLYASGIQQLYPDMPVTCQILFTAVPQCVSIPT